MRPPNPGLIEVLVAHIRNNGMRATVEALWMATIQTAGDAAPHHADGWLFVAERVAWFRDTFALRDIDRQTGKD